MKINATVLILLGAALGLGVLVGRWWQPQPPASETPSAAAAREVLYWVAPMDRNYRRDEPGKSPMGMDLVPVYADQMDEDPGVVSIDPTMVSNLGVRTEPVQRGPLSRQIATVGYVGYDEDTLQQVAVRVEGWIERLAVKSAGEAVQSGQVLFELYAPALVNAQEEYLAILSGRNTALQQAARARLAALGVSADTIERLNKGRKVEQRSRVFAARDGVVAHLAVREGAYVTPASQVMAIADLSRVWIMAEVFERQATWLSPGLEAVVELDSLPGQSFNGAVDYVYPELDATTRTLRVRLRFSNPDRLLRPNMLAQVQILAPGSGPVVHVPRQAVIRGGDVDRVVLALGKGRFRSQPVELGMESGDRVAIQRGVAVGDEVVTSAQFLIDSESNIAAALARFQADGGEQKEMNQQDMDHADMEADEMDHSQMDHDTMEQRP